MFQMIYVNSEKHITKTTLFTSKQPHSDGMRMVPLCLSRDPTMYGKNADQKSADQYHKLLFIV